MIEHLTLDTFKEKVFNFTDNKEWKFEGTLPCIIDFYADWCGPCKMVAPILEELAKEYAGKITVAKVNTDENSDVSYAYRIMSIPTLILFKDGKDINKMIGALPKEDLKAFIDKSL